MSMMPNNPPNDGRNAALDDPRDLVLSASAGTGKTTMLVEKFTRVLIGKIREEGSADAIRSLVGITFTDLAAMELKDRIRKTLTNVADMEERNAHADIARALRDAVRDLDTAYIGTIHGFCRRVLQENFVAAGISPGFRVLDERDAVELKNRAAFEVLRKALSPQSLEKNSAPLVLAQSLGLGRLRSIVLELYDSLRAHDAEHISIEEHLAPIQSIGTATADIVAEAKSLLEHMEADVTAFNKNGGNKTSQKIEVALTLAREALTPYFEQPDLLRRTCLPELFAKQSCIPGKGNMKGLDEYATHRLRFRELLRLEPSEGITLRDLELLDVQIEMLRTLLSFVKQYAERYSMLKERSDSLDFDDLQLRALRLLEDNKAVLARYHAAFSHIFVDEFQDVNAVQRRLVQLLRGFGSSDSGRHLFLVGDSKQSIYRFRAADVRAYNEFAATIEERGKRYELRLNFRSHDSLIDSFNKLFAPLFAADENGTAFQAEYQPIEPGKEHAPTSSPLVRILELSKEDKRYEAWVIANRIRALVEDGLTGYEGEFGYGDIAILFRSTSILPEYEMELRRAGVPYAVIGGKGFHQQREVWDIASYLNAVWFPQDEYALAAALRSPLCLVSDESLYELRKAKYFTGLLPDQAPRTSAMEDGEYERFSRFNAMLRRHRRLRDLISSAEMIDDTLATTGYDAVLLAQDAGDQGAANVRKLIEMAREFETRGVGTGLEFALDLSSRLFSDKDEAQASLASAENAVKLLTVHKSKGLEFPVVILPHLSYGGKPLNDPILYEHDIGIAMRVSDPATGGIAKGGLFGQISANISEEEDAEHLRLFYVAATRAEELLILPASRERHRSHSVTSWLERMENIDVFEPEVAEKIGIGFEADEPYTSPRTKRPALIEAASGAFIIENKESAQALARLQRTRERPEIRPSRRLQISVSALLDLMSDEQDDDFRTETQQIQREMEQENEAAATDPRRAGTAVHAFLESLNYKSRPDEDHIRNGLSRLGLRHHDEEAKAINRWLDSPTAAELFSDSDCRIRREVPFVLPVALGEETIDVIGVIDLLAEFSDGRRWLLDFKFAHQKENTAYEMQMQLYALAIERSLGKLPQRALLYWLKDGIAEKIDMKAGMLTDLQKSISEALKRERSEPKQKTRVG